MTPWFGDPDSHQDDVEIKSPALCCVLFAVPTHRCLLPFALCLLPPLLHFSLSHKLNRNLRNPPAKCFPFFQKLFFNPVLMTGSKRLLRSNR